MIGDLETEAHCPEAANPCSARRPGQGREVRNGKLPSTLHFEALVHLWPSSWAFQPKKTDTIRLLVLKVSGLHQNYNIGLFGSREDRRTPGCHDHVSQSLWTTLMLSVSTNPIGTGALENPTWQGLIFRR